MKFEGFTQSSALRLGTLVASPRAPFWAAAALTALLGMHLGASTWALLPEPDAAKPALVARASAADAGKEAEEPTALLARLHLFGQPPVEEPDESLADAPETQLNLTLKGLFVPGDSHGMAIITAGSGEDGIYSVGDTVVGNASIAAILRDRVVVERDGVREVLLMEGVSEVSPTPRRRTARNPAQQRRVETARRLRDQFRSEPASLARMVRFRPARENGELVGYRIRSRSAEFSLEDLGVRTSDVVTRINGVPLDDPRRANEALISLRDAQSIQLGLLRNGQPRTLSIAIGAPS